ncbi:hypothetical protein [Spirochaeta lutea]|uniref:Guanylate cyclase domain-containing protein n=1 Tax=Spirochaeta lutea TaxID=1480694 RepID=A0A098R052_9SPIO|nr:hypothetical protein [Spirochaeta lutea]KGE72112.1 hypothetical protein DC28_07790 [Spirochaeta lutea]
MAYEKMVVIFADLLGSKSITDFNKKYIIHKIFHEELILNQERQKLISHVIYDRKIFSFSDCVYIFYFYKKGIEESRKNDLNLIKTAILNTTNPFLQVLLSGNFLRGGITFGDCYFDDLGFFGPAVNRAYEIESTIAEHPIIEVDNVIGKEIFDDQIQNSNNELFKWKPSIVNNLENKYFMNYLYQLEISPLLQYGQNIYRYDESKKDILDYIHLNKQENSSNIKIINKMNYLERVINLSRPSEMNNGIGNMVGVLQK